MLPKVSESKTAACHKEDIDDESTAQPGTGSQEPSKISKTGPRCKTPNIAASIAASRMASRPRPCSTTTRPTPSLSMSALIESPKETSSARKCQPSSIFPGAEAVDGPGASYYENDEYTLTAQTTTSDNVAPRQASLEPVVTATLVENNEVGLEGVHEQLRQHAQELEQIRWQVQNTAVVAEVVPNDIESSPHECYHGQDTSDNPKPCSSYMNNGRKKCIFSIAIIAIIIVGVVVGVVVASNNGQPIQQAQSPPTMPQDTDHVALQDLTDLLSSVSLDGGVALQTDSTPQNNALKWLSGNANLDSYSNKTKIQRYVLAALYYSTNGHDWANNAGWLGDGDECEWWNLAIGPFCIDGAVAELDLNSNNLVGTIPVDLALLSTSVETLSQYKNKLTGIIPSEIGLLTNLYWLNLYDNNLTGTIPSEIGLMTNLDWLNLYDNNLTGTIPSEIGLMMNLDGLDLYNNKLMGTIPSEIGLLTNFDTLNLDSNPLTGTIPSEVGLLTRLNWLGLSNNDLTGSIPSEIGLLTNLDELYLYKI